MNGTVTVTCPTNGCENEGVEITVDPWDGSTVICGPCGTVLEAQADWYQPPNGEELGVPTGPEQAADLINGMTPAERAALIALLGGPNEGETQ